MKPNPALPGLLGALCLASCVSSYVPEPARFEARAARVTITRDDWGIAHVRGKTDADAVFGMIYAQAEDDFNRVETNYLTALGRLAEAEGESAIWSDLRQRLFIDPDDLKRRYAASPAPLKQLMDAWADGLNHYLLTHPETHPRVIRHFEPWMTLSFSEGSIGGDIATISLQGLEAFYGAPAATKTAQADTLLFEEPRGSNGVALGPSITRDGHALLLINPHTSFYFRSELQMTSEEGLNAYGAATWGQFFIYQGFNEHAGWMHTTSTVDSVDEFAETIVERDGKPSVPMTMRQRPPGSLPSRSLGTSLWLCLGSKTSRPLLPLAREQRKAVGRRWFPRQRQLRLSLRIVQSGERSRRRTSCAFSASSIGRRASPERSAPSCVARRFIPQR
jgi:acyl-homoserine-lactone acylase